jgi:molybdopterin/thiamine biosynthesis adenylyltransferase
METFKPEKIEKSSDKQADIIIDEYKEQLLELFLIRNPKYRFDKNYQDEYKKFEQELPSSIQWGQWFYFPWNKTTIHYLPENEYLELRTARNKNLITKQEQEKFYNACIGIAGLSVGSHCALTIAMMGGSKKIKLADPDVISVSNLNRIRYGASALNKNKAIVAARIIAEMNPYAQIEVFVEGLNPNNIDQFFEGLDIFVEETDSLALKISSRERAKQNKIPVIMATDNGDGVIVDVERYDLQPDLELFNGALGSISMKQFENFPPTDMPKLATKVAGPDYIVPRMQESLLQVGRNLYSWPQLGSAATFSGIAVAYIARKIIVGDKINSGKYDLNLDAMLDGSYNDEDQIQMRKQVKDNFLKILGLNE